MEPRKSAHTPPSPTATAMSNKKANVTTKATAAPTRSSRIAEKPAPHFVRRYMNGLMNLEAPPGHLLDITKRNATDSPLLRLPPELRNKIWELAMGGQHVKAWTRDSGPDCAIIKGGAILRPQRPKRLELSSEAIDYNSDFFKRTGATKQPSAFHLPEVCRQVYSETATLAYKLNIFILGPQEVLYPNWATMLLPAQREAITRMEPEPRYLMLLVGILGTRVNLRDPRNLPSLRTIFVSDDSLNYVSRFGQYHGDLGGPAPKKYWEELIEKRIKEYHGDDLEVIFAEYAEAIRQPITDIMAAI